jgi:hypothetical protein
MPMTRRTTAEPSDLQPVRASTRNPKPSRKRIQSLSQPTPHQAKRSKTRRPLAISSESPPSAQSASESIELSEDNPGFEIVVETDGDEQQEQQDETQDDNAEEEEEEEERPMRFQTIWRAVCDRESLPSVYSSFHTKDSLFLFDINSWRNKLLHDLEPRVFRVSSLLAIATYERYRQADEFLQELSTHHDLDTVLSCMEEWHKQWPRRSLILRVTLFLEEEKPVPPTSQSAPQPQARGRRTAIQAQLNTLPHVLAAEKAGNNLMPSITDRWARISTRCRNKGKTCWRSKKPGAPDTADNHYPVPSDLLFRWSKEVRKKAFTVE